MPDYSRTPYKQNPDGSYDQPKLALPRVERRCVVDKLIAVGLAAGVMTLGVTSYLFGRSYVPEPMSNEELSAHLYLNRHFKPTVYDLEAIQIEQNTDDVISLGAGASALVLALAGGLTLAFRMNNNINRRNKVRQDVADDMMMTPKGELVQRAAWEAANKPAEAPVALLENVVLKALPYDHKVGSQINSLNNLSIPTDVVPR